MQTQNQRALLSELEELLVRLSRPLKFGVIHTADSKLYKSTETPCSLSPKSHSKRALTDWKKLLLNCIKHFKLGVTEVCLCSTCSPPFSHRVADMAATMERLDEYRTYNAQFCKRLYDFLSIMCTAQVCNTHSFAPRALTPIVVETTSRRQQWHSQACARPAIHS